MGDRQYQNQTKRYPGGLAHVVSGMYYSVVANRRQRDIYKVEGGGGYSRPRLLGWDPLAETRTRCQESFAFSINQPDILSAVQKRWGQEGQACRQAGVTSGVSNTTGGSADLD